MLQNPKPSWNILSWTIANKHANCRTSIFHSRAGIELNPIYPIGYAYHMPMTHFTDDTLEPA
jgi:hypothetical protein